MATWPTITDGVTLLAKSVFDSIKSYIDGLTTLTFSNTGLKVSDTDASNTLTIAPGSNLTADRTLTVTTGDAARTLTLTGNPTLDQDVSTTGSPTFAAVTTTGTVKMGSSFIRNRIINGDMRIAQRATSSGTQGYSTLDRFYCNRSGGVAGLTMAQVYGAFSTTKYCLTLQRDNGNTNTANMAVYQAIEGLNSQDLAGKNVTVSFQIGTGSISSTTGHSIILSYQTTTTDKGPTSAGWTDLTAQTFTVTASSSFTQKTATFAVPSTATQLMAYISLAVSGTAGADDRFYITEIQVEEGSVATPFERRLYTSELALCQRYYWQGGNGANGIQNSGTTARYDVRYPVIMRSAPTIAAIAAPNSTNPTYAESVTGSQTTNFMATAAGGLVTDYCASKIQFGGFSSFGDGRPCNLLNTCVSFSAEL